MFYIQTQCLFLESCSGFSQDHLTWHNLMEGFPLGPMAKYENSLSRGIYGKRQKMKKMLFILIQLLNCEFATLFTVVHYSCVV